jgi:threonine synthase
MKVISTRNPTQAYSLSDAMQKGLADDGGLFVPEKLPTIDFSSFPIDATYCEFAALFLQAFFVDDVVLASKIPEICKRAFNFTIPLQKINDSTYCLELFHGPTNSFKDFGARFLAECLQVLNQTNKTTILVATSGDTGSAVASAFHGKENVNVIVLFPKGKISARQEKQITCWQDNITAVEVDGNFDDCQRLVKSAYAELENINLSTANSINIGRLLPQMIYYAYHARGFQLQHDAALNFIVPSGNLGNVTACFYAKALGFPIDNVILATNNNTALKDYLETDEFVPRSSVVTLANAMDVGNPSNLERLQYLFSDFETLQQNVKVIAVDDEQIKETIKHLYNAYGLVVCPHTATGFFAREQLIGGSWVIVSTADPAKFDTIVEPLVGQAIAVSAELQNLLDKPNNSLPMAADLNALKTIINQLSD